MHALFGDSRFSIGPLTVSSELSHGHVSSYGGVAPVQRLFCG